MRTRSRWLSALVVVAASGVAALTALTVSQGAAITVTGCIERDAASSQPIYKVVVAEQGGGSTIYQLNAADPAPVSAAVGKMARVSGAVSIEKRAGREIKVLAVKSFDVVAEGCRLPQEGPSPPR